MPDGVSSTTFIERSGRLEFEGGPAGYSNQRFEVFFDYDEPWRVQCRAMVDPASFTSLGEVGLIGLQISNDSGFSTGDEFVAFRAASGVLEPGGSAAVGLVTGWADETVETESIGLRGSATPVGLRIEYHPADRTLHLFSNEDPGLAEGSWSESAAFTVDGSTVAGAETLDWGMGVGNLFVLMFSGSVDLTTLGADAAWVDDFEVRTLRPLLQPTPRHVIAEAGDEVVLSVTADGPGPLTYQWFAYNGGIIPIGTDITGPTLTLPDQTAPGLYQVQVSNDYGTTENEPTAVSLTRDGSHSVSLTVEGSGLLSFRPEGVHWETLTGADPASIVVDDIGNPLPANPEERFAYIERSFFEPCVTLHPINARGTLSILQQPTPDNGHELILEIDDTGFAGSATYGFRLFGRTLQKGGQDPVVILDPVDRCAPTGGAVRFTADVFHSEPITMQWRHNGVAIPGANGSDYLIPAASAGDAGSYDLVYTDPYSNSWTTAAAELTLDTGSPQTLTFAPLDPILTTAAPFELGATSDSGLTPEYSSNHHDIALVCGGLLKPVGPGSVSITARQDGNGSYHAAADVVRVLDVYEPIVVTSDPSSQSVDAGSDVTFEVVAEPLAFGTLSYQWLKDGVEIPGATNASLSLVGVTGADAGNYTVRVSHPAQEVTSVAATLTVNKLPQTITFGALASRLTTDLPFSLSASATSGLAVSFASSNPLIASVSGNTVTLHGPGTVVISAFQAGDDTYLAAADVEQELVVIAPVSIDSDPLPVTVDALQNATFEVVASGSVPLAYQWRRNGVNLPGATSSQLQLTAVTTDDEGNYDCVVTNTAGSATSNTAALTVNRLSQTITFGPLTDRLTTDPAFALSATASSGLAVSFSSLTPTTVSVAGLTATPLAEGTATLRVSQAGDSTWLPVNLDRSFELIAPVVITGQPVSTGANALESVIFSVTANGTGPLSYQWRFDGVPIAGATGSTLTLNGVTTDDEGGYDCVVSNSLSNATSAAATLTVTRLAQTITFDPLASVYDAAANFALTATASSGLAVSYTSSAPEVATVSGSTVSVVAVGSTDLTASQAGNEIYAPATPVVRTLTVLDSLTFSVQPVSLVRNALEDASFSVVVSGQEPFSYQWRKGGVDIPGATGSALALTGVTTDDEGSYDCVVTNAAGSKTSDAATLTVNRLAQTITFLTTLPTNLASGGGWPPVLIVAEASSGLPVSFQSDSPIVDCQEHEPDSWQIVSGNGNAGSALITASQSGNTVWAPATPVSRTLVIQEPVVIQSHPADQTVETGASASFSVSATGTELSYQWRKSGEAIPGATTASFTIASASEADAGSYDCVVSNPATTDTSTAAVLTVVPVTPQPDGWEELAVKGEPAPDYPAGGTYTAFLDAPLLGASRAMWRGKMSTPTGTLDGFWYRNDSTGADVLGIAGKALPEGAPAGATLYSSTFPTVSYGPNATVLAEAFLQGGPVTSATDKILLSPRYPASGSRILAREGDSAGISDWVLGRWSSSAAKAMNGWNQVSFTSDFSGSGVNASNQCNVWTTMGRSHPLVRQGYQNDSVPGAPGDEYHVWFGGARMAMNASGVTAFFSATYNRSTLVETSRLLVRGGGVNRQVANETMVPPGLPTNYRFSLSQAGAIKITDGVNPWVVFADMPTSGLPGIWRWRDGVIDQVASVFSQTSEPAGLSVTPQLTDFAVDSYGRAAFLATLAGAGTTTANNLAIVVEGQGIGGPGTLEVRYREGDRLPGMPEGSTVTNFQVPSLSDSGRLAFVASYLDGGVLRTGLWVETDRLRKVCATGDLLTCGDGTTREVSFLAFRAGGHSASDELRATSASGWDDDGTELVFRASYTDGAQAIWRVDLDSLVDEGIYAWFTANGLTGADAAPEANPAGDGISNLLKYAFNMDPNTAYSGEARHLSPGSGQSGLPSITGIETPGGRKLRIEFLRRRNDASIIYQPRFSTDLQGWVPAIATPVVTPIDAEWERVVVEDLIDAWDRRFGQVMVEIAD